MNARGCCSSRRRLSRRAVFRTRELTDSRQGFPVLPRRVDLMRRVVLPTGTWLGMSISSSRWPTRMSRPATVLAAETDRHGWPIVA